MARPAPGTRALAEAARRQTRRIGVAFAAVDVLLPLGLLVFALLSGRAFWKLFRADDAPTEWLSSVQCLAVAGVAYANYAVRRALGPDREADGGRPATPAWVWLVFAVGFVLLGLDERFDFHEMLRDRVFRPAGLFLDIPFVTPGDVGLFLAFGVGVAFSRLLLPELRGWPPALPVFVAALALTGVVVLIDGLDDATLREWPLHTFWDYPFEEVGELWAQLGFLVAFLVVLRGRLGELAGSGEAP